MPLSDASMNSVVCSLGCVSGWPQVPALSLISRGSSWAWASGRLAQDLSDGAGLVWTQCYDPAPARTLPVDLGPRSHGSCHIRPGQCALSVKLGPTRTLSLSAAPPLAGEG